jgi:peptidyl-prolyl cis-trans isomerase D
VVKPETVPETDARQRYEQVKGERFGTPEKRTVQQIVFPTMEQAEAASKRIADGTSFETVAAENNVEAKNLDLGTFAKTEMFDPAVADAAFSLPEGGVSRGVQGRFGNVLVRVTKVQPGNLRPFEEVAAELSREIAAERGRGEMDALHDAIEDLRASAQPLATIARDKNLPLIAIPALDRSGHDKAGNPIPNLPERDQLVASAFNSDIGADNEPLRTRAGGYVWYEVTGVEPGREKTLDEVRDAVAAQWRSEEVSRLLADKGRSIVERLDKGESLDAIAGELSLPPKSAADLARGTAKDDLPADVVNRVFSVPVGKVASAAAGNDSRVVFKVAGASLPPLVTSTSEAQRLEEQLRIILSEDLLAQYIAQLQKEFGVSINQQNMRRATGGES